MKFVIQRVQHASVTVDEEVIGKIGRGYMVLIGVCESDDEAIADKMVDKMIKLRINEDAEGKTNLSLRMWTGAFSLYPSSHCMPTARRATDRPSWKQARRIRRTLSMSTSSKDAEREYL